jgi:hypothetical protein
MGVVNPDLSRVTLQDDWVEAYRLLPLGGVMVTNQTCTRNRCTTDNPVRRLHRLRGMSAGSQKASSSCFRMSPSVWATLA